MAESSAVFNSLSWCLVISYLWALSGNEVDPIRKNYCHRIKKNHDSLLLFLLGASALLHLWFIVQYHWEIVPVHVKWQKHSFPSITSYQSSVQVICIRGTAALWVFGFVTSWCLYNSLWRVESSIFVPVTDPHTSLVKLYWLYDGSEDVFSLLLYIVLPLECSQGTGCS